MSLDPITAGIDLFTSIVNKVFPDKSEQEKQQIAQQMALEAQDADLLKGQQEINKQEATNSNLFVSGARPFAIWICDAALLFNYVLGPYVINPLLIHFGQSSVSPMNMGELMPILLGLLGLSSFRTYERINGVIPKGK